MRKAVCLCSAATFVSAISGCVNGADSERVTSAVQVVTNNSRATIVVAAASSLQTALNTCKGNIKSVNVQITFAGSDQLAQQVRQGVKFDLIAAANAEIPEQLFADGLVERPKVFTTNQLVIATASGSRRVTIADLDRSGMKLAVGNNQVPIGKYTDQVFAKLGKSTHRRIESNVKTREPDVASIVGKIKSQVVDAGIVYKTDVLSNKLVWSSLKDSLQPSIKYEAAVTKRSENRKAAELFLTDLRSGSCQSELQKVGFGKQTK